MPHRKAPKAGDKQISATFLKDLDRKCEQVLRVTGTGGMSLGASGIAFPNLQDDVAQLRRVYIPYAPGAFGGWADTYGDVFSNTLAVSYNTVIKKGVNDDGGKLKDTRDGRKVYPSKAYFLDVRNEYENSGQADLDANTNFTSKLLNFSSMPITFGRGWAVPLADNPDYWALVSMDVDQYSRMFGLNLNQANGIDDFEAGNNTWGEVRALPIGFAMDSVSMVQTARDFATIQANHAFNFYINHPGDYELTFGCTVQLDVAGYQKQGNFDIPTTTNSGHAHTLPLNVADDYSFLRTYVPVQVNMALNFNGRGTTPYGDDDIDEPTIPAAIGTLRFTKDIISIQQTSVKFHTLDNTHGSHYLRVTPILGAKTLLSKDSTSTPLVRFLRGFIKVRPLLPQRQIHHSGINPYAKLLTGYTDRWQWWGGGPEPPVYDEFGVAVP